MRKKFLISIIDVMVGLTNEEKKELENLDIRKVELKYKLVLTEKTDEMIG
ncbi:hypothetical protein [Staphylococcus simulans]|nr:hypothetical protein [Staphylococcus simulans]